MAEEERRVGYIDCEAKRPRGFERARHIRRFEEAMMDKDVEESLSKLGYFEPAIGRHDRNVFHHRVGKHHAFMENLVVLQVVKKRTRYHIAPWTQEHGSARNPY